MNDKITNLLNQYEMEVNRTFKGRGTIICDTDKGVRVLREYKGNTSRLVLLSELQNQICEVVKTDKIVKSKEDELFVSDVDGTKYILKEQIDGRECSYKSEDDVTEAFRTMALIHKNMVFLQPESEQIKAENEEIMTQIPVHHYSEDMIKHTNECRHVKNYLKKLSTKNHFERALMSEYQYYYEKAIEITKIAQNESKEEYEAQVRKNGTYCHGDYQYHNVLFLSEGADIKQKMGIINLEHFMHDLGVKDFYLLFRKISEKSDWSLSLADKMINAYQSIRTFNETEWTALKLMLMYPEKFWKIVNFYYNSRKSWIPGRNQEKLEKLVSQEKSKEKTINRLFL